MPIQWQKSENILWFVLGENGSLWCSTASFTRRGAIEQWGREQPKPWKYWYRHGFRCKQVELRYRPVPNGGRA